MWKTIQTVIFFKKKHTRIAHINNQRGGRQSSSSGSTNVASRSTQTAINNRVQIKTFVPRGNNRYDLLTFMANIKEKVKRTIRLRARHSAVKWYIRGAIQKYTEKCYKIVMLSSIATKIHNNKLLFICS